MTQDELLQKIMNGVPCRWIPRSISGIPQLKTLGGRDSRDLFLGGKRLSQEDGLLVIGLSESGKLTERRCEDITYYEVPA